MYEESIISMLNAFFKILDDPKGNDNLKEQFLNLNFYNIKDDYIKYEQRIINLVMIHNYIVDYFF